MTPRDASTGRFKRAPRVVFVYTEWLERVLDEAVRNYAAAYKIRPYEMENCSVCHNHIRAEFQRLWSER